MATQTLHQSEVQKTKRSLHTRILPRRQSRWHGKHEHLGGKGAGLPRCQTPVARPRASPSRRRRALEYMRTNGVSAEVESQMDGALKRRKSWHGQKLGKGEESAAGERALGAQVLHATQE